MATNVDGSITIDSRIDSTGFNAGLKKITASAQGALKNVQATTSKIGPGIQKTMSGAVAAVGKFAQVMKKVLLAGLLVFGASIGALFAGLRDSFSNLLENNLKGTRIAADIDDIKNKFTELKFSIVAAFLPLVEAAIPYIKAALDWLTKLFNAVAVITAAWLGQKEVMQIIPGSAAKFAKETEKAKKSAQGALAAFDQINVLAKQTTDTATTSPQVETTLVPVTPEAVNAAKTALDELKEKAQNILSTIAESIKDSFLDFIYWDEWVTFVKSKWQEFKDFIFLDDWVTFFTVSWDAIKQNVSAVWEIIKVLASAAWEFIKSIWSELAPLFQVWWDTVVNIVQTRFQFIKDIVASIVGVFDGIITFIVGVFTGDWQKAWTGIVGIFESVFGGIKAFVKLTVNSIIDVINGLLRAVALGVNAIGAAMSKLSFTVPEWVPGIGGSTLGIGPIPTISAPQIPKLATGAVIPGGSAFAAILGDQPKGQTNIEAPENLIRQIIREEMGNNEATVPIVLTLDGEVVWRNQQRVQMRRGKSLLAGGNV